MNPPATGGYDLLERVMSCNHLWDCQRCGNQMEDADNRIAELEARCNHALSIALTKMNRGGIVGELNSLSRFLGYDNFRHWLGLGKPQCWADEYVPKESSDGN